MFPAIVEKSYSLALAARLRAHAPYSKFLVGAALKAVGSEQIFVGCNVENASYPAGICAERAAVMGLISALGKVPLEFIVLVTDSATFDVPCGICLQVLSEFCPPDFPIYVANLKGIQKKMFLKDFLPHTFVLL